MSNIKMIGYFLKVNFAHILASFVCALFLFIIFFFTIDENANCLINILNLSKTNKLDIVYTSTVVDDEDTFYEFNGLIQLKTENNIVIYSDIVMTIPNMKYVDNKFGYEGGLEDDECAVCQNLCMKLNLEVGDFLTIRNHSKYGEKINFKITKILDPQLGITPLPGKNQYLTTNDGIIIVGTNKKLIDYEEERYLTFKSDINGVPNVLGKPIYYEDVLDNARNHLIQYFSFILCMYVIFVLFGELLSRKDNNKFNAYYKLGINKYKLYLKILSTLLLKYALFFILSIIVIGSMCLTKVLLLEYLYIMAIASAISLFSILLYSVLFYWRTIKWRKIKMKY